MADAPICQEGLCSYSDNGESTISCFLSQTPRVSAVQLSMRWSSSRGCTDEPCSGMPAAEGKWMLRVWLSPFLRTTLSEGKGMSFLFVYIYLRGQPLASFQQEQSTENRGLAGEMAQRVKAFAAKPDDLTSIPRTELVERTNSQQLINDF